MNPAIEIDDQRCRLAVVADSDGDAEAIFSRMTECVVNKANRFTARVGNLGGQRAVVASGGGAAAASVLEAILVAHRPQLVVAAGLASGLTDPAAAGVAIVADEVVSDAHKRLSLSTSTWRPDGVCVGPLLSRDRPTRAASEKQALADEYQVIAVDRDSFALAQTCADEEVPFLTLCVVTDGPDDELPQDIQFLLDQRSRSAKAGALAGTLMRHPSHLKHLWKLNESALKAGEKLADWVVRLANDLRP